MKKKMNNKGFSLVELIIVIAIMAVLVGVLAPQYTKYVASSRVSTDCQNAEELANAISVALADSTEAVAITSGTEFSATDAVVTDATDTAKVIVSAPTSKVDAARKWVVTFDATQGVTQVTLGGKVIWPTTSAYN